MPYYQDQELFHIPFGDWLVRRGLIDRRQLFLALSLAHVRSYRIGDAIVALQLLERELIEQEAEVHDTFVAFTRAA
jgi:hypothetical protein